MTTAPLELDSFDIAYFEASTGKLRKWGPETDPLAKALNVRAAFKAWDGGKLDSYLWSNGEFDFGPDDPLLFPSCSVSGLGKEATIAKGQRIIDPNATGLQFQLRSTTLSDMTLVNDCGQFDDQGHLQPHEDGGCVGFLGGPYTATIRDCNISARDWAVFLWEPSILNRLLIEDCDITTGRVGIASESSGVGQNVTVRRSRIYGDANLSKSEGATSNAKDGGVFGVVHRGGLLSLSDTEIKIIGGTNVPRACAITDHGGGNDGISSDTQIELYNHRSLVMPKGAKSWYDLDIADQSLQVKLMIDRRFDYTLRRNF